MKKKVNIFLLLFVLAIWGAAGYRYVSQYFVQKKLVSDSGKKSINGMKIQEKDTFELRPLGRDPFLNTNSAIAPKPKHINYSGNRKREPKKTPPKSNLPFPNVNYFGYIKSKQQQKELVLLKVNNKLIRMRIGESVEGLKVVKIYLDSVQIIFSGESRTFRKQGT